MTKKQKILLIVGIVLLLACIGVLLSILLPGAPKESAAPVGDMTYTVQIKNASDKPLPEVGVYVYEDATMAELIWYDTTDETGKMSFTQPVADTYVAVLADVPAGYVVEEYYPLTGEVTQIILSAGSMTAEDMQAVTFKLGDMMMDFSVTTPDGKTYTLSELLKTKRAVILNFWYIECQPCNMEFPYMQEAYEEYADLIEILALNPVNQDPEAVAAFQKQLGLTFPMAVVDPVWEQMMQLTAYPTTVVIDRYGNISLIHKGMVDNTDTFLQLFEYFTADDYEPKAIENLADIVTPSEGSEDNPFMTGGDTGFEITVGPGETYHFELYKLVEATFVTVSGEDFYLTYGGKQYTPKNGSVTITVKSDGPSSPVSLAITNTGEEEQTYQVTLSKPKGTYSNPYTLTVGDFTVNSAAGNDQGVYYRYYAKEDGYLSVQCLSISPSYVKYGLALYNLSNYNYRNLSDDGETNEDGEPVLIMPVKKGQVVQFTVSTMPDAEWNYPAATFKLRATFSAGEVEEQEQIELPSVTYSVTVKDQDGNPMPGVTVNMKGTLTYTPETEEEEGQTPEDTEPEDTEEEQTKTFIEEVDKVLVTDANGVASLAQLPGTLNVTVKVPDGYKTANTAFTLTEDAPGISIVMQKIVMKDYSVNVTYPGGEPVERVLVIVGSNIAYTDAQGKVSFNMEEGEHPVLVVGIPKRYALAQESYAFSGGTTSMTVALVPDTGYAPEKPFVIHNKISVTTNEIPVGVTEYYEIHDITGAVTLELNSPNAVVAVNGGEKLSPDASGLISASVTTDPVTVAVTNNGTEAESFTIDFTGFPEGSYRNPEEINAIRNVRFTVPAGATDGYYMYWEPTGDGILTLTKHRFSDENIELILSYNNIVAKLSDSADGESVSLRVQKGVPVLFQGLAIPAEDGTYPEVYIRMSGDTEYSTDPTYSVTVTDGNGAPQPGVQVQFLQDGAAVGYPVTTNGGGVAEAALPAGNYTIAFVDSSIIFDAGSVALTAETMTATAVIAWPQATLPEGVTRYSVTVTDFEGNLMPDLVVLFMQNGAAKGYSIVGESGGVGTADLPTGTYNVQVAFLGETAYYYDTTTAVVTPSGNSITIQATAALPGEEQTFFTSDGQYVTRAVKEGGTYISNLQTDIMSYYAFRPTRSGTYTITVSGDGAKAFHYGGSTWPALQTDVATVEKGYVISVGESSIGTDANTGVMYVIGVTGTSDGILRILRTGDAAFNEGEVDPTPYENQVTPTPFTMPSGQGAKLKYIDLYGSTGATQIVKGSDGYYHLGSATGPVVYLNLGLKAPYVSLYQMVGGTGIGGTALRYTYYDADGEFHKIDYTQTIWDYAQCMDETYGVYPLTVDLIEALQKGGKQMGWWDPSHPNYLFEDTDGVPLGINNELGWLFACCYVSG